MQKAAAVQQRQCPQLSYSLAVSAAVLLKLLNKNKKKSSTEKQSSAMIVHTPRRTATSTRTTRTRQNNPYRLGAAPAGAIGPRGRCFPAATVPVAVVFACVVCCCIAENKQKKQTKYNHQPKNRALPSSSTNQSAQQRVREQYTQGRTIPTGLARRRQE